jgi:hypothetical protein
MSPYTNKRTRFSAIQDKLLELKEEGLRLDNEFKMQQLKKIKLEIVLLERQAGFEVVEDENLNCST